MSNRRLACLQHLLDEELDAAADWDSYSAVRIGALRYAISLAEVDAMVRAPSVFANMTDEQHAVVFGSDDAEVSGGISVDKEHLEMSNRIQCLQQMLEEAEGIPEKVSALRFAIAIAMSVGGISSTYHQGYMDGCKAKAEAFVTWLREEATASCPGDPIDAPELYRRIADIIEREEQR